MISAHYKISTTKHKHPCIIQATANDSPSVGEYPASVGVVKRDPAYISLQPSRQQIGAVLGLHSQYC